MDHILYSPDVVKTLLDRNNTLYTQILDDEPDILRIESTRRLVLIYGNYIEGTSFEPEYKKLYDAHIAERAKLNRCYKYEAAVVTDLDRLIQQYGWKSFMFALVAVVDRVRQRTSCGVAKNSWGICLEKLKAINKSLKYL